MIKQKKLTSKCGITIPKDLRAEAGIHPNEAVDMVYTGNGILIRKHTSTCFICSSPDNVIKYGHIELCADCAKHFNKEA